jgi:DNA-binding beta-propeller fold protein YncE
MKKKNLVYLLMGVTVLTIFGIYLIISIGETNNNSDSKFIEEIPSSTPNSLQSNYSQIEKEPPRIPIDMEIPTCYEFDFKWGSKGIGDGQFLRVHDVDFDPSGRFVYVSDRDRNDIQKFFRNGTFVLKWGSTGSEHWQFNIPYGLDVDSKGFVYVADRENHRIQKFDSEGNWIFTYDHFSSDLTFKKPEEVEVDDKNDVIFVADTGNDRIIKFDKEFNFLGMWGTRGSNDGEFKHPHGLGVDSEGNLFVSERDNSRIQKFDGDGNFILSWGKKGDGNGEFVGLEHLEVGPNDMIVVTDGENKEGTAGDSFQIFDKNGNFIFKIGSPGIEEGQFGEAEHPGVDSEGNIYISERKNARISAFKVSSEC